MNDRITPTYAHYSMIQFPGRLLNSKGIVLVANCSRVKIATRGLLFVRWEPTHSYGTKTKISLDLCSSHIPVKHLFTHIEATASFFKQLGGRLGRQGTYSVK